MPSSANPWLQFLLKLSSYIHAVKARMASAGPFLTVVLAVDLVFLEIILAVCSLPSYIFLAPVPVTNKDATSLQAYRLRRAVTLSAFFGVIVLFLVYLLFGLLGSWFAFGARGAHAGDLSWNFNAPEQYVYDVNEIQITDGAAVFRAGTVVESTLTSPTTLPDVSTPDTSGGVSAPENSGSVNIDTSTDSSGSGSVDPGSSPVPAPVPEPVPEPTPEPIPVPPPAPNPVPIPLLYQLHPFSMAVAQAAELPYLGIGPRVCEGTLQPLLPVLFPSAFRGYSGFTEVANKNGGEIYYQLSTNGGASWVWWNGSTWEATVIGTQGNTAADVNAHIADLPEGVNGLTFRARFHSDCVIEISLYAISVSYEEAAPPPNQTFFTLTAADLNLTFTDSVGAPLVETERDAYVEIGGRKIAFIEASANVLLSSSSFNVSPSSVSVNLGIPLTGVGRLWLLVPKTGPENTIRLCPGALLPTEITVGCLGKVTLSAETPELGGFALARLDDPDYWYVEASLALPSLGVASVGTSAPAPMPADPVQENAATLTQLNTAPIVVLTSAAQETSNVLVSFTLTDGQSDYVSLPVLEYSASGLFAGEQQELIRVSNDSRDDGVDGLTSSPTGINHQVVWDARASLGEGDHRVFLRARADDGLERGPADIYGPVLIDFVGPAISGLHATQPQGSNNVTVTYASSDPAGSAETALAVSLDQGLNWQPLTDLPWDAFSTFPDVDRGEVIVRASSIDRYGNSYSAETNVTIDTKAPYGLTGLSVTPFRHSALVSWDALAAEAHFKRYVVRYNQLVDGAISHTWSVIQDQALADQSTTSTVISVLNSATGYEVFLDAEDDYGHVTTLGPVSVTTLTAADELPLVPPVLDTLPDTTVSTEIEVSGTTTPGTTVDIIVDGETVAENIPVGTNGSFEAEIDLTVGEHVVEAVVSGTTSSGGTVTLPSEPETVTVVVPTPTSLVETVVSLPEETDPLISVIPEGVIAPAKPVTLEALATPVADDLRAVSIINSAKTSKLMPVPKVAKAVPSLAGRSIYLAGTALPHAKVALFLHSEQAVIYTTTADESGLWSLEHQQKKVALAPGQHTVYSIAYDEGSRVKSGPSEVVNFDVRSNALTRLGKYFDLPTTLITLAVALIAFGTLYALGKQKK